ASRRRHTTFSRDWSSDVCSSDLDSSLGQDREAGAIGGSGTLTLTAKVVDEDGVPLPDFNGTVRLRRLPGGDGVTTIQGLFERKRSEERRVGREGAYRGA